MKIVFAQGNPGKEYEKTRHNAGFIIIDALAAHLGATWKKSDKFSAEIAETTIEAEKVLLVKPLSFYNDTGLVARALIDFYKLTPVEDFLVLQDDLALPVGTIRVRPQGSDAGNNGIKSLNAHLGATYWRIRIGIWNELKENMNSTTFVLGRFSAIEFGYLTSTATETCQRLVEAFVQGELEAVSHTLEP